MKKPAFYTAAFAMGDLLCATPTIRKLYETYGEKVHVFSHMPELFENLPYVSGSELYSDWYDKPKYDFLCKEYDFNPTFLDMGKKIQLSDKRGIELRHAQMDIRQYHAIELGFMHTPEDMQCDYVPTEPCSVYLPDRYVCIHPSKTWDSRSWSKPNWERLIKTLEQHEIPVVIVGKSSIDWKKYDLHKPDENVIRELSSKGAISVSGANNFTDDTSISQLWHILSNAHSVITMDSGILHLAGTTDTQIFQLGSSINPYFRAPYRKGTQQYRYEYLSGTCDKFCASSMRYSLRDWKNTASGATPIQNVTKIDSCLEHKKTFDCHPLVEQVIDSVIKHWHTDYEKENVVIDYSPRQLHVTKYNPLTIEEPNYILDYEDGIKLTILGKDTDDSDYDVKFFSGNELIHQQSLKINHWVSPSQKSGHVRVTVQKDDRVIFDSDSYVGTELIVISSDALGDTIGALSTIEKYRKITDKKIHVACNFKELFTSSYHKLSLHKKTDKIPQCKLIRKVFYKFDVPLLKGYAMQLGIDEKDLIIKIDKSRDRKMAGKYFCYSMHSTAQCKFWNRKDGWKDLNDMMRAEGYTPICVDRYKQFGIEGHWNEVPKNSVNKHGMQLKDYVSLIQNAEFFVGISSGMSWVAHALGVPTVIISGVTSLDNEFSGKDVLRIQNDKVCNSCFHTEKFEANDWLWCPRQSTENKFICTTSITAEYVHEQIKKFLDDRLQ